MKFTTQLLSELSPKHLLKHPFYKSWTAGTLPLENLKTYTEQYYHHVAAFPRYVSATHSGCADIKSRQVLLENLIDEEKGVNNHPELWLRFAEALNVSRQGVKEATPLPETQNLVNTFMNFSRSSYAEGLGALFAYENQVPEVAASKIEGLKKFYGVTSEQGLKFFDVHLNADKYHTEALQGLLEALPPEDQQKAKAAAHKAAECLWGFLDAVTPKNLAC